MGKSEMELPDGQITMEGNEGCILTMHQHIGEHDQVAQLKLNALQVERLRELLSDYGKSLSDEEFWSLRTMKENTMIHISDSEDGRRFCDGERDPQAVDGDDLNRRTAARTKVFYDSLTEEERLKINQPGGPVTPPEATYRVNAIQVAREMAGLSEAEVCVACLDGEEETAR